MKLFSGTSNEPLAQRVAERLGVELSRAEVMRFDNSEVRVRITDDVQHQTCVVIQSTSNPTDTNLMELVFFCDALRRMEAKKVIAVIPYFGYSRQNIQHRVGECVSSNVVVRLIESIGFDKVYTFDLHDKATGGIFHIPFRNLTAMELLADASKDMLSRADITDISPETIALVSPDQGGINKARYFGELFFETKEFNLAVIEKRRSYRQKHESISLGLYGDVRDKPVIIVDDMITSGGTLLQAVRLCKKHGATHVFAAATHPDFTENAPERISDPHLEALVTTDTIRLDLEENLAKLSIISVADYIAHELKHLG